MEQLHLMQNNYKSKHGVQHDLTRVPHAIYKWGLTVKERGKKDNARALTL